MNGLNCYSYYDPLAADSDTVEMMHWIWITVRDPASPEDAYVLTLLRLVQILVEVATGSFSRI